MLIPTHTDTRIKRSTVYLYGAVLYQCLIQVQQFIVAEVIVELLALCGCLLAANLTVDLTPCPTILS